MFDFKKILKQNLFTRCKSWGTNKFQRNPYPVIWYQELEYESVPFGPNPLLQENYVFCTSQTFCTKESCLQLFWILVYFILQNVCSTTWDFRFWHVNITTVVFRVESFTLHMEVGISKMLVIIYQTTWHCPSSEQS